jgi:hypothetical protein
MSAKQSMMLETMGSTILSTKERKRGRERRTRRRRKRKKKATPLTTGVGEDAGKKEPSYTVGGNVN